MDCVHVLFVWLGFTKYDKCMTWQLDSCKKKSLKGHCHIKLFCKGCLLNPPKKLFALHGLVKKQLRNIYILVLQLVMPPAGLPIKGLRRKKSM